MIIIIIRFKIKRNIIAYYHYKQCSSLIIIEMSSLRCESFIQGVIFRNTQAEDTQILHWHNTKNIPTLTTNSPVIHNYTFTYKNQT